MVVRVVYLQMVKGLVLANTVFRRWAMGGLLAAMFPAALGAEPARADAVRQQHQQAVEEAASDAEREMAVLRARIFEANQHFAADNRELQARQRELELTDPIARGLREKLIEREKELLQLRQSLQSRLDAIPEIQEIRRRRDALAGELRSLRQRERELLAGGAGARRRELNDQ